MAKSPRGLGGHIPMLRFGNDPFKSYLKIEQMKLITILKRVWISYKLKDNTHTVEEFNKTTCVMHTHRLLLGGLALIELAAVGGNLRVFTSREGVTLFVKGRRTRSYC